jgi:AcrR family transcriptional regulator
MAKTKERILDTTAELFRRHGYTGTGIKQIVENANAPFGSIYHFFPGGKEQLGEEVIRRAGQMYAEIVEAVLDAAPDPVTAVSDACLGAAEVLRATDYVDACPIATVALEVASSNDRLRQATADVFADWIARGTERLVEQGLPRRKAHEVAIVFIELLEGAFILSRAMRSTEPLEIAAGAAAAAVRAAVPAPRPRRGAARSRRPGSRPPEA